MSAIHRKVSSVKTKQKVILSDEIESKERGSSRSVKLTRADSVVRVAAQVKSNIIVGSPLAQVLNVLKKDTSRARAIAVKSGVITPKKHKLKKDYA